MRLRRLDLTRYGKFTDYTIEFGEHIPGTPDLHIVYGLNEAGKSTSLSAYLDLLFGIEERTRYAFLHQGRALEIGGCLEFGGRCHELKRVKQRSNSLLDPRAQPVGETLLSVPLAGLTREGYRMMFSLDDETLEQGGDAILKSEGDLGELLFSASAGLAGISATLTDVAQEADEIFRKRASSTRIAELKRQLGALRSRRDEIDTQASAYAALVMAHKQAEKAYDDAMREKGVAKARYDEIERLLRAHPLAIEHGQVREQLHDYRDLPRPPDSWISELPELIEEEIRLQTRLAGLDQQEEHLCAELEVLHVDDRLLTIADQLDQLSEFAARYRTAEGDLPKRKAALSELEQAVSLIVASLGKPDVANPTTLLVPAATLGILRDLIAAHSGVNVASQSAAQEHKTAAHVLEDAKAAQKALGAEGVILDTAQFAHIESIVTRLRQGDRIAELRLSERRLPEKKKLFADAIAPLSPWSGDGEALRRMTLPDIVQIERWRSTLSSIEKRRAEHAERTRELVTRLREDTARLAAIRDGAGKIGDEDAHAILASREEAWRKHLTSLDRKTAGVFEERMRAADEIASARLTGAKELAELRFVTSTLVVTKSGIERQDELQREIDGELRALRAEIFSETPAAVVFADNTPIASCLQQLERWQKAHSNALSAWDSVRASEVDIATARKELEAEQLALLKALTACGMKVGDLPLPSLLQVADGLLAEKTAARARQVDADKRVGDLERELADRTRSLDAAKAAQNEWQRSWSATLESTWFVDRAETVSGVRELIDSLSELPGVLRNQAEIRHRIEAMECDRNDFMSMVTEIHALLGETFDSTAPLDATKALARRFEEAKQILAKRQDKEKGREHIATERESLSENIARHDARKKAMVDFFETETLTDVRNALDRCAARDRLMAAKQRLERQITGEVRKASLEDAQTILANLDLEDLQREHAELTARLEDIDERTKVLYAERSGAADQLNAIGGDDAVARIEAERKTILLEIEELAVHFLRLRTGVLVAEHALRAYRDKHRSAMMSRASEAFRLMTRDEYSALATRPEKDREALIGLARNGGSKLAVDMSKGTRFQLYLALRLAGYEEFAALRPPVPFIADDIMETFDEPHHGDLR